MVFMCILLFQNANHKNKKDFYHDLVVKVSLTYNAGRVRIPY